MKVVSNELPQKTVEGRLSEHVSLSLGKDSTPQNPLMAKPYNSGIICIFKSNITLNNKETGQLIAVWPKGSLSAEKQQPFKIKPILTSSGPVVIDHQLKRMVWLYPINLNERFSLTISDIDLKNQNAEQYLPVSFASDENGKTLLRLQSKNNKDHAKLVLISADGLVIDVVDAEDEDVLDLAIVKNGLLSLSSSQISLISTKGAETHQTSDKVDSLWPSPDGNFVITTGEDTAKFSLYETGKNGDQSLVKLLEGMHLDKNEQRLEGWKFWDVQPPDDDDPTPLERPVICWSKDSRLAVLGDSTGLGTIIDPNARKAVKLMGPAGETFWPLEMVAPNTIIFLSKNEIGQLVLNWNFGEPLETETSKVNNETKKAEELTSAEIVEFTGAKKSAPWLVYAIIISLVTASLLIYFFIK